jgi:hypothetical protein
MKMDCKLKIFSKNGMYFLPQKQAAGSQMTFTKVLMCGMGNGHRIFVRMAKEHFLNI